MRLSCIRTNCTTNIETVETHLATVEIGFDSRLWVKLKPGVTGYESASVDNLLNEPGQGWCACAGTKGSWDKLVVPKQELERLDDVLRLLAQPKL